MKYLIYIAAIIVLIGINLGFFENLQLKNQIPNLVFLFTLCACLEKKNPDFFFVAFFGGLFLDFYSASFFGSFTFSLLVLALALHFLANNLVVLDLNWKTLSVLLLSSLLLLNLCLFIYGFCALKFGWTKEFTDFKTFANGFLVSFIYNLLLLYPVFVFYNFVKKIIDNLSIKRRGVIK